MTTVDLYYVYDQEYLMPWRLRRINKLAYETAAGSSEEIKSHRAQLTNEEGILFGRNDFCDAYMTAKKKLVADAYGRSLHHAVNMALFNLSGGHIGYNGYRSSSRKSR